MLLQLLELFSVAPAHSSRGPFREQGEQGFITPPQTSKSGVRREGLPLAAFMMGVRELAREFPLCVTRHLTATVYVVHAKFWCIKSHGGIDVDVH